MPSGEALQVKRTSIHLLPCSHFVTVGLGVVVGKQRDDMATRWTGRLPLSGSVVALAAMGMLATSHLFAVQLAAMALFGCGLGLALPSTLGLMTLLAEAAGDQGRVGGLSGAAQGLGLVFGPLVGAASYKLDRAAPYVIGAILLMIACGLRLLSARTPVADR